ncbi:MAG: hypothetical protein ACM3RX_04720 [Methanococcaceae archaeon]
MPDQDAVVAITAETADMQNEINLVWDYLLPAISNNKLPADVIMEAALKEKLFSLALAPAANNPSPMLASYISGKIFSIEPNEKQMEHVSFLFKDNICNVILKNDTSTYKLAFGAGNWIIGETTRRGPNLISGAKASFKGLLPTKIAGCFSWKDENTIELILRYIESPHTEKIICRFEKNKILINILNSLDPNSNHPLIHGEIVR